jgi:hypothetical protein
MRSSVTVSWGYPHGAQLELYRPSQKGHRMQNQFTAQHTTAIKTYNLHKGNKVKSLYLIN